MFAETEAQVVDTVRAAREGRRTLEIVAGGTRRSVGLPAPCDEVLDVSRLRGIVDYQPEELILTVRPSTPLAEIENVLATRNQRLGFEPQDWSALLGSCGAASIGGAVSANADGPAAVRFGRARDHLLGIRAVNGFGEAFKAGGKVVKNVTGFDIPKLFCGALGTLGVLTELTFRVFPKGPSLVLAKRGLDPDEGFALLREAWSSPLDATALILARDTAYVRIEGEAQSLAEKRRLLDGWSEEETIDFGFAPGPRDIWRVLCKPTDAGALVRKVAAPVWYADRAGALLWMAAEPAQSTKFASLDAECVRGSARQPRSAARAELDRRVKAAFDPLGLFNPGRMGV